MIGTDDGRALGSPCGVPPSAIRPRNQLHYSWMKGIHMKLRTLASTVSLLIVGLGLEGNGYSLSENSLGLREDNSKKGNKMKRTRLKLLPTTGLTALGLNLSPQSASANTTSGVIGYNLRTL